MFDLKTPCRQCPFRRSQAANHGLSAARIEEFATATAFQCHKTLGGRAQQCAGAMAMLHDDGQPNQIMQVASRLIGFDAGTIDRSDTFPSVAAAIAAHNPVDA